MNRLPVMLLALWAAGCGPSGPMDDPKVGEGVLPQATSARPSFSCTGGIGITLIGGGNASACEERDYSGLGATGSARIRNANGSNVAGGVESPTLTLRAYVHATSDTQEHADALLQKVTVHTAGNDFYATGPQSQSPDAWWVDFDLDLPTRTSLASSAINGDVYAELLVGRLSAEATNGSVTLLGLAGSVTATSVNGSVDVDLSGASSWSGGGVNAMAQNGGVTFHADADYSGHFVFSADNGSVTSDFGGCDPQPATQPQRCDFVTGSGGATLRGSSGNGNVTLSQDTPGLPLP
ncbi:MAG TPA: hypothetical protein VM369_02435 [Candidatus Binatia bacterium]|nr:hypothetical protein [Candidatus Binatia bacterium]